MEDLKAQAALVGRSDMLALLVGLGLDKAYK